MSLGYDLHGISDRLAYYGQKAALLIRAHQSEKYVKPVKRRDYLLGEKEVAQIKKLAAQGMSHHQIAIEIGRSSTAVKRVVSPDAYVTAREKNRLARNARVAARKAALAAAPAEAAA